MTCSCGVPMVTRSVRATVCRDLEVCPVCDGNAARVDLVRPLSADEVRRRALEDGA